jgi:hypothetical protein
LILIIIPPCYENGTNDGTPAGTSRKQPRKDTKMNANQAEIIAMQHKMDVYQAKIVTIREQMIAKRDDWLQEMKANPKEIKYVAKHEEVPKENTAVKPVTALKKWHGD